MRTNPLEARPSVESPDTLDPAAKIDKLNRRFNGLIHDGQLTPGLNIEQLQAERDGIAELIDAYQGDNDGSDDAYEKIVNAHTILRAIDASGYRLGADRDESTSRSERGLGIEDFLIREIAFFDELGLFSMSKGTLKEGLINQSNLGHWQDKRDDLFAMLREYKDEGLTSPERSLVESTADVLDAIDSRIAVLEKDTPQLAASRRKAPVSGPKPNNPAAPTADPLPVANNPFAPKPYQRELEGPKKDNETDPNNGGEQKLSDEDQAKLDAYAAAMRKNVEAGHLTTETADKAIAKERQRLLDAAAKKAEVDPNPDANANSVPEVQAIADLLSGVVDDDLRQKILEQLNALVEKLKPAPAGGDGSEQDPTSNGEKDPAPRSLENETDAERHERLADINKRLAAFMEQGPEDDPKIQQYIDAYIAEHTPKGFDTLSDDNKEEYRRIAAAHAIVQYRLNNPDAPVSNKEIVEGLGHPRNKFLDILAKNEKNHKINLDPAGKVAQVLRFIKLGWVADKLTSAKPNDEERTAGENYQAALDRVDALRSSFLGHEIDNGNMTEAEVRANRAIFLSETYAQNEADKVTIQQADDRKPMNKWLRRGGYVASTVGAAGAAVAVGPGALLIAPFGAGLIRWAANKRNANTVASDGQLQANIVSKGNVNSFNRYINSRLNQEQSDTLSAADVVKKHWNVLAEEKGKNVKRAVMPALGMAAGAYAMYAGAESLTANSGGGQETQPVGAAPSNKDAGPTAHHPNEGVLPNDPRRGYETTPGVSDANYPYTDSPDHPANQPGYTPPDAPNPHYPGGVDPNNPGVFAGDNQLPGGGHDGLPGGGRLDGLDATLSPVEINTNGAPEHAVQAFAKQLGVRLDDGQVHTIITEGYKKFGDELFVNATSGKPVDLTNFGGNIGIGYQPWDKDLKINLGPGVADWLERQAAR